MTLTLDATACGTSANSYATLAEATTYFEPVAFTSVWGALTEQQQIAKMLAAARAIDRLNIKYAKYASTQALEFPRDKSSAGDAEDASIPAAVKNAQCEMVIHLHYDQAATGQSNTNQEKTSVGVPGAVTVAFQTDPEKDSARQAAGGSLQAVHALLRPWVSGMSGGGFSLVR